MKRILIVNVNWLGDVLFSTPAIRAIRKKFPESFIACLVPPRCEALLKNNPYLNEVILCEDRHPFISWFKFIPTVFQLRKRHFDTAIFFHRSRTKVFLAWLAGIPERIGFQAPGGKRWLTRAVAFPKIKLHKTDIFLKLLEASGIPSDGRVPDFVPAAGAADELSALFYKQGIDGNSPYVVVHAGGNWDLKRWPAEYFMEWSRLFRQKFPWKIILCGTDKEEALSDKIAQPFKSGEVVSFCGKTSLDALALLLKGARLLVSNDSGPIHLAASQRTKILGLFGPTSADETGPISDAPVSIFRKDVGCEVPCYYRACNYRICMEWLTPGEAFLKAQDLLADSV